MKERSHLNSLLSSIVYIFQTLFVRKETYPFFKIMYLLSLRGIGLFNFQNTYLSGENWFLNFVSRYYQDNKITVFDVGANKGEYVSVLLKMFNTRNLKIIAFEPNKACYQELQSRANKTVRIEQIGLGKRDEKVNFYDDINDKGSGHASIFEDVLSDIQNKKFVKSIITLSTIDTYCKKNNINKIQLLKIDTEGNEYAILQGAKHMINSNKVDMIQFEFNSMNVISGVFFKNFINLLPHYDFYRLMPNGMIRLTPYDPMLSELFGFQNIVALNKNVIHYQ